MDKLNRIKAVLAEHEKPASSWQYKFVYLLVLLVSGAKIPFSQTLKH